MNAKKTWKLKVEIFQFALNMFKKNLGLGQPRIKKTLWAALKLHLGSPQGEVDLVTWQNSQIAMWSCLLGNEGPGNIDSTIWQCPLHNLAKLDEWLLKNKNTWFWCCIIVIIKNSNTRLLFTTVVLKKKKMFLKSQKNNCLQKPLGLLWVLSWNLMVLRTFWNTQNWRFFGFWNFFFKNLDPAVPSIPNFLKYPRLSGITKKTSDTHPHTGGSMDTLSDPC
jgi:hypothetical protein